MPGPIHLPLLRAFACLAVLGSLALLSLVGSRPAGAAQGRGPGPGWVWPIAGQVHVIRPFEPPAGPYAPGHRGVDLAARPGDPIRSAGPGTVVLARQVAGRPVVVIAHGDARTATELRTTYQPVQALVPVGRRVDAGEVVGRLGTWPGHCSEPGCLHWGLRRGTSYLDPTALLAGPVRLLPVGGPVPVDESPRRTSRSPADRRPASTSGIEHTDGGNSATGSDPADNSAIAGTAQAATVRSSTGPPVPAGTLGLTLAALGGAGTVAAVGATRRYLRNSAPRGSSP